MYKDHMLFHHNYTTVGTTAMAAIHDLSGGFVLMRYKDHISDRYVSLLADRDTQTYKTLWGDWGESSDDVDSFDAPSDLCAEMQRLFDLGYKVVEIIKGYNFVRQYPTPEWLSKVDFLMPKYGVDEQSSSQIWGMWDDSENLITYILSKDAYRFATRLGIKIKLERSHD